MSADHWMRFNVGDYLADTMHLSTIQHGAYLLLIMHYFKRGELPVTESGLARIAKIPLRQWRLHSPLVMALFRHDNDAWKHKRIDAERAKLQRKVDETHARGSEPATPARVSPDPSSRAHVQKPELKLVRGTRFARPARGGFAHNVAARRAAGAD
jgi:uncharacterized protein YdaU (DUF1376 family)